MNQHIGLLYDTACIDYSRCWEVGLLLIRSDILGNEVSENRKDRLSIKTEEIVNYKYYNGFSTWRHRTSA